MSMIIQVRFISQGYEKITSAPPKGPNKTYSVNVLQITNKNKTINNGIPNVSGDTI